jgi:predicted RNA-binding protein YlqC (UPF0109 family)
MQKMCLNGFSDKQFVTQGTRYKRPLSGDYESPRGPSEGVQVRAVEGSHVTVLELKTHPEDLGRVIRRQERTAETMRTLFGAAGVKLQAIHI